MKKIKCSEDETQRQIKDMLDADEFKSKAISKVLIIFFGISFLVSVYNCMEHNFKLAFISILQTIIYAIAWMMGMKIIKGWISKLYGLLTVLGILLVFPFLSATTDKKVDKIDWDAIFLGSEIPKPVSAQIEVHTNTEDELWIDVLKISESEYYKYIKSSKEFGYNKNTNETSIGYDAYNNEGFMLELCYYKSKKEMSLKLERPTKLSPLNWNMHNISYVLPEPISKEGIFKYEKDDIISLTVGKTDETDYEKYISKCIDEGFSIDQDKSNNNYSAYKSDGHFLRISYNPGNSEMDIDLKFPEKFDEIVLPVSGLGALLPTSNKNYGYVLYSGDTSYSVKFGNVSKEEYEEYIEKCKDNGFDMNIRSYQNSFNAAYNDDNEIIIDISLNGINIMEVRVLGKYGKDYSKINRNKESSNDKTIDQSTDVYSEEKDSLDIITPEETNILETVANSIEKAFEDGDYSLVTPEFKAVMDEYEAFYDSYYEFMRKYTSGEVDFFSVMDDYNDMVNQMSEWSDKIDKLDDGELSAADHAYYLLVTTRIMNKGFSYLE